MIIDQHRAHIRVLYENYMQQLDGRTGSVQKVLFPEIVQLDHKEAIVMEKVQPEMEKLGFDISDLGGGSYAVNGIPSGIEGINVVELVCNMVATAAENGVGVASDINHSLAVSLARNAAIPHGQVLNNNEMENLVNELFACSNVNYTPDGKSILTIFRQSEMERLLG